MNKDVQNMNLTTFARIPSCRIPKIDFFVNLSEGNIAAASTGVDNSRLPYSQFIILLIKWSIFRKLFLNLSLLLTVNFCIA